MAEATRVQGRELRVPRPVQRARPESYELVRAATAAGLVAGAAMLVSAGAGAALAGLPPSRPLALTAAAVARDGAGGLGTLLLGALLWAGVSVALALLFATFVPRDFPFASTALLGVGYAFAVLAVTTAAVLPRVNPEMRAAMSESGGAWVLAYAAFGVALGLVPVLRRRWSRRGVGGAREPS